MPAIWLSNYPPASPSAYDDEFEDSSLDAAWTEFDIANLTTVTEGAHGLTLTRTGNTAGVTGIYRALPADDWSAWTQVSVHALAGTTFLAGIFASENLDLNPTTADIHTLWWGRYIQGMAQHAIGMSELAGYTQGPEWGLSAVNDGVLPAHVYLRLRYYASSYDLWRDFSTDGIGWQQIGHDHLASPAHFGLFVFNTTNDTRAADFAFFRVVTGTPTLTDVMGGRRVDPDAALFQAAWARNSNSVLQRVMQ